MPVPELNEVKSVGRTPTRDPEKAMDGGNKQSPWISQDLVSHDHITFTLDHAISPNDQNIATSARSVFSGDLDFEEAVNVEFSAVSQSQGITPTK